MPSAFDTLWLYSNGLPRLIVDPPDASTDGPISTVGRVVSPSYSYEEVANASVGAALPMFGGADFYDRIHYEFVALALGNLLGEQTRTLWVWNAYRRVRVLEGLTQSGTEGITLTDPGTPPLAWAPLELKTYQVGISFDGPPVIDAELEFDWDLGELDTVTITGTRVIPWSWAPDWSDGILERLEWRTDVLQAYRGEEQRRAVRRLPRRTVEFSLGQADRARRTMEAALWGWGGRVFAVPLWWDGLDLPSAAGAGDTVISCDPATRDFQVGMPAIFLQDFKTYETVEISEVGVSSVTLRRPLASSWAAGTRFMPARVGRIDQSIGLERFDGSSALGRMRFALVDGADYAAAAPATHNGYPVLEIRPNWTSEPSIEFSRKLAVLDAIAGKVSFEDEAQLAITRQRMRWTFTSRAQAETWRKLLYTLRGRQAAIYVPTWTRDLVPVTTIASNALAIDVEHGDYKLLIDVEPGRRDIRIELANGTILYRKITGASELTADTERINIDASLGVTVTPSEVASISFMALSRLDSDAAELAWWTGDVVESALMTRTFRHDL